MDLYQFVHAVYILCMNHHGSVTSWIRSRLHNVAVHGNPRSLHVHGLACDLAFDSQEDQDAAVAAAPRLGLHYLIEANHLHVQAHAAEPLEATEGAQP